MNGVVINENTKQVDKNLKRAYNGKLCISLEKYSQNVIEEKEPQLDIRMCKHYEVHI